MITQSCQARSVNILTWYLCIEVPFLLCYDETKLNRISWIFLAALSMYECIDSGSGSRLLRRELYNSTVCDEK